jgi:type IV fimbrial biogenesis protein FimT
MLKSVHRSLGFTLIELLITITLVAVLMLMAVPALGTWSADARVRSTAESLQSALRLAQATAVSRSRTTVLALTNADPAWNARPTTNGGNWYVRVQKLADTDDTIAKDNYLQGATMASQYAVSIDGPAVLCFNAMGRQAARSPDQTELSEGCAPADPTRYRVHKATATREFEVQVDVGGRVRMCDRAKTLSNDNPDGC